ILSVMKDGAIAGYPMQNIKVSIFDGKEHPVDSKPVAFESAARGAFKMAVKDAGPVLYEPIMKARITVPDANMGDVIGDLNTRRGRMQGTDAERGQTTVIADVPLAEMLRYTSQLRSITGGRGYFEMVFDRYEVVPSHVADGVIAAAQSDEEEE
ncbi:MAG: elongation factor G, partial [Anaerolineae bacterium]|nr:elongation factor G [Anaerolineae bacterium]